MVTWHDDPALEAALNEWRAAALEAYEERNVPPDRYLKARHEYRELLVARGLLPVIIPPTTDRQPKE